MPLRPIQYTFTAGELSPLLGGRVDVNRYFAGCARLENYRTLPTGGAERRAGTLFIAAAKYADRVCRLERFEFSVEQAYMLEMGHEYIRVYTGLGRLEVAGVPVEVATPYQEADLFQVQCVQSADVLYCVHPAYPPHKLLRLGATTWQFKPIVFRPQPAAEAPTDLGVALTLSAVSGLSVTATAASAVFLDGDVDRHLVSGDGRAILTSLGADSPSLSVTCLVLSAFDTVSLSLGSWHLEGSPVVALRPSKRGPVGALVTLTLEKILTDEPELVSNGTFSAGLSGWTDHSGPVLSSGTATSSGADLVDTTADFVADGVEPTQRVLNVTDASEGGVGTVATTTLTLSPVLSGGSANTWAVGNSYEVRQTGSVTAAAGQGQLHGGTAGVAWIGQGVTTQVGRRYRVSFVVREQSLSVQVGSTATGSDLLTEATVTIGEQAVTFTADTTTSYVQFRNNQNQAAVVDDVSVKSVSAQGFRSADVGKLVTGSEATVELTRFVDATSMDGVLWAAFPEAEDPEDPQEELVLQAGAWSLGVPAWSASRGYPRAVSFSLGRFTLAGPRQEPLAGWDSVVGDFENFALGTADDAAIAWAISANTMNVIEWLEPLRDLLVGTRGGEHILTGGQNPRTPSNLGQIPQSTYGAAPLRPLLLGDVSLLMLQRGGRKVQEFLIQDDTGLLRARDVTILAEHVTRSGIRQWAYQRQPVPTVWAVRHDGQLLGWTFDLQEEVRGWHRHTTTGAFESVATMPVDTPEDDETEQVWLACRRTVEGSPVRYIEVMRGVSRTAVAHRWALTVDSALQYRGAPATTFSGLAHLEGLSVRLVGRQDVQVELNGEALTTERLLNLGTQTVVSGQVTTSLAVSALDVGLDFAPILVTLRPEVSLQDGTLQMRRKRWVTIWARLAGSLGLAINGKEVPIRTTNDAMGVGLLPTDLDVSAYGAGWNRHGQVTIEQTLPFPSTILALVGDLEVEEVE